MGCGENGANRKKLGASVVSLFDFLLVLSDSTFETAAETDAAVERVSGGGRSVRRQQSCGIL